MLRTSKGAVCASDRVEADQLPGTLAYIKGLKGDNMAAMKPRTGDGPLEVTKEGRGIVMRVPLEGGGRLVVEMTKDEANDLSEALKTATG
jgi:hypothetical protein